MYRVISVFCLALGMVSSHYLGLDQLPASSLMTEKLLFYVRNGILVGIVVSFLPVLIDLKNGVKGNLFVINAGLALIITLASAVLFVVVPIVGWVGWQMSFSILRRLSAWAF